MGIQEIMLAEVYVFWKFNVYNFQRLYSICHNSFIILSLFMLRLNCVCLSKILCSVTNTSELETHLSRLSIIKEAKNRKPVSKYIR